MRHTCHHAPTSCHWSQPTLCPSCTHHPPTVIECYTLTHASYMSPRSHFMSLKSTNVVSILHTPPTHSHIDTQCYTLTHTPYISPRSHYVIQVDQRGVHPAHTTHPLTYRYTMLHTHTLIHYTFFYFNNIKQGHNKLYKIKLWSKKISQRGEQILRKISIKSRRRN